MVHISNILITKNKLLKLYQLLFEIFEEAEDKEDFFDLIKDVLSPPEQIMVAKRIAIIYLLIKGIDQSSIAEYLGCCRSTVGKFNLLFYEKDTRLIQIIKEMLGKEKVSHFLEDLFADIFIHPGIKIGHWQSYWDHKRRQEDRKMVDV